MIIIRGEEPKGDLGGTFTFVISVKDLHKGRKPFYVLSRKNRNDSYFASMIHSEVHKKHMSRSNHFTTFEPQTESITRLVNNDQDRELKIDFL